MTTDQAKTIGFIGLGNMGFWMATNLAEKLPANAKLMVFDIVPALMDELCSKYPEKILGGSGPKDVAENSVNTLINSGFLLLEEKTLMPGLILGHHHHHAA